MPDCSIPIGSSAERLVPEASRHRSRSLLAPDGTSLHVVDGGEQRATRGVVFVHGFAQSSLVFEAQLHGSSQFPGWQLIAFDLRGHGWSSGGHGDYDDSVAWAGDLQTVIDGCRLQQVVLVAWSYGGFVVGDFLAHGGDAAGLVLVAAGSNMTPAEDQTTDDEFLALLPALRSERLETSHRATRRLVEMLTYRRLCRDQVLILEGASARSSPEARRGLSMRTRDVRETLTRSGIRTLVVHGQHDELLPLAASASLADACGAEMLIVPDAGHMPFLERPHWFNDELNRFLRSLSAG